MHEVALAQSVCETVRSYVGAEQRLLRVVVECGPMCGVEPDALEFCFGIVAEQAGLAPAALELRVNPADASCPLCGARFSVASLWSECPECGQSPVTVTGGGELRVKEIEVGDV